MTSCTAGVPGFKPSVNGLHFSNSSWPKVPDWTIPLPTGGTVPIGDASNGMCGGMTYTVRDLFQGGFLPPTTTSAPASGPLFTYVADRLLDSFNLPGGPAVYLELMNPALPDHETAIEPLGHGRAWRMINDAWPQIKTDLDSGRLSPVSLIEIKTTDPTMMGKNHQVLAYGYDLSGSNLTICVYDPNHPDDDSVTISLDISHPTNTTAVTYSRGDTIWCFFRSDYGLHDASSISGGTIPPPPPPPELREPTVRVNPFPVPMGKYQSISVTAVDPIDGTAVTGTALIMQPSVHSGRVRFDPVATFRVPGSHTVLIHSVFGDGDTQYPYGHFAPDAAAKYRAVDYALVQEP